MSKLGYEIQEHSAKKSKKSFNYIIHDKQEIKMLKIILSLMISKKLLFYYQKHIDIHESHFFYLSLLSRYLHLEIF